MENANTGSQLIPPRKAIGLVRQENGNYSQMTEARGGGRKKLLTESVNVRVSPKMKQELDKIAEFELSMGRTSEMVRGWMLRRIHDYQSNPRYKSWLKQQQRKEEMEE